MEAAYTIDEGRNLIRHKLSGTVSVDDCITAVDKILTDPKFRTGMDSVTDMTEAIFAWDLAEMDRFRAYMNEIKDTAGECKWALIATMGITHLTAKLFLVLHEEFGEKISVMLFSTERDALAWIEGDTDQKPE